MTDKPRAVLPHTDPSLRVVCDPVPDGYGLKAIAELFDELHAAMRYPLAVGLAAPQIGENLRAIVIRVPHGSGDIRYEVLNPEIYWTAKGRLVSAWEGCLSFNKGVGFRALVPRHRRIKVRGYGRDRMPVQFGAKDFIARVLQHEIDHLDGKLMTDNATRIDDGKRRRDQQPGKPLEIGG